MNDIKRRIKSVTSTRQITKAMELVSTAKLKRARTKLDASKPYFSRILNSITEIMINTKGIRHPFLDSREVNNTLYIVITGDRGLAGGYNSNICKLVEQSVVNKTSTKLITIGSKGRDYFKARAYDVIDSYIGVSETPSFEIAQEIGNMAIKMYCDKEIDEIKVVYTEFISTISYEPKVLTLLPVVLEDEEEIEEDKELVIYRYEPSPEAVFEYLVPKYINSLIYGVCIESSASESGSRRVAMESATDNAEEMIDDLQLIYNRVRQAAITQEISEIVAGADAQN